MIEGVENVEKLLIASQDAPLDQDYLTYKSRWLAREGWESQAHIPRTNIWGPNSKRSYEHSIDPEVSLYLLNSFYRVSTKSLLSE